MTKKFNLIRLLTTIVFLFIVLFENSFALEMVESEYIVRIFDNSSIGSLGLDSKVQDANSKNKRFIDILEDAGIEVIDSFIEDQSPYSIQSMSKDGSFSETIASEIGFVFLVKSNSLDELTQSLSLNGISPDIVEPNYTVMATSTDRAVLSQTSSINPKQQKNYELINLAKAWNITTGSNDVSIAVLDTGVDFNHMGLSSFIDTDLGRNFTDKGSPRDFFDREGHGTHVAGIISSSGTTSGVMKKSSIIPLKVLDENGNGNTFDLEKAILYSIEIDVDIINMSLGGPNRSSSLERTIQLASDSGIIMVASSGNDGKGDLYYPAKFDPVISVGSVDSSGRKSDFSNYGYELDIMAPGQDIYSTLPRNRYGFESGTSSSAPHVAGIIGLARSINPHISTEDIRSIFMENSSFTKEYGFGVIDAESFLQSLSYTRMGLEDANLFGSETISDLNKNWTISFNLDLDSSTLNDENIYIIDSKNRVLPSQIVSKEKSIVLKPLRPYRDFEDYRIYISKDVRSLSGSPLKYNFRFDFTVREAI